MTAIEEVQLPPSWDGSALVDIGGDVGALILRTPPMMVGDEIGLDAVDPSVAHVHSAVHEHRLGDGSSFAAVYPSLRAGDYLIEGRHQRVTIVGGRVVDVAYDRATVLSTAQ